MKTCKTCTYCIDVTDGTSFCRYRITDKTVIMGSTDKVCEHYKTKTWICDSCKYRIDRTNDINQCRYTKNKKLVVYWESLRWNCDHKEITRQLEFDF